MKKRRLTQDKKYAQRVHAKRRAAQRYDLVLSRELRLKLLNMVWSGAAKTISHQSHRLVVKEADLEGTTVRFVYDRNRKNIVTFLHTDEARYSETG